MKKLLSENEACSYLGISRSFLAKSRMTGLLESHRFTPPPFIRLGGAIRYDVADLDAWIAQNRVEMIAK